MSDLENLWDDYPTGPAPVRAILAEAAGRPRRRRRLLVRPLLTAGAVTGLAGAFVAGTLVGGGPGSPGGPGTPPGARQLPSHVAFQADLDPAKSCADLLDTYVERASALVGPWGWGGGPLFYATDGAGRGEVTPLDTGFRAAQSDGVRPFSTAKQAQPRTQGQNSSETGTNVQEAGVDEPDTVKTDGRLLVVVRDDELVTYDVSGSSTEQLASLDLPGIESAEILLAGDTVVAIGADDLDKDVLRHDRVRPAATRVLRISVADPDKPAIEEDVRYSAGLLSARQHGEDVRIVLASGLPDLDFVEPRGKRSAEAALKENRALVAKTKIEDWLPSVTTGGTSRQLLDCTNVAIPSDELAIDTTSVVGFRADTPAELDAIGLAGHTGIAYESADHLYLATQSGWAGGLPRCIDFCDAPVSEGTGGSSYLFDFELDGTRATHVASGEVEGAIRDRWSVDEADGILRVAVGPTSETGNFSSIVTFKRDGEDLVEHGRLDGLGRNEDIQSMRWFDDLAIMVTFRRVDPLYSIDLTDPAKPRLLGKLKIPGFSSYLHPLGPTQLLGVGEGPDGKGGWGAQIGLFDVDDLSDVKRLDVKSLGVETRALAGVDPRTFTWLPDADTAVAVVEKWSGRRVGLVAVVKVKGGRLEERLQRVEYGDDVDHVRAVPLPDGRVVLVTGEAARFFEL